MEAGAESDQIVSSRKVYVSVGLWRLLRSCLIRQGLSVSEWFRRKAVEELRAAGYDVAEYENQEIRER